MRSPDPRWEAINNGYLGRVRDEVYGRALRNQFERQLCKSKTNRTVYCDIFDNTKDNLQIITPKLPAVIRLHGAQGDTNFQSLKQVKRLIKLSSIRIIPIFSKTSPEIKLLVGVSKCSL